MRSLLGLVATALVAPLLALVAAPAGQASSSTAGPDPAARKAAVRSVLKQSGSGELRGRLVSDRAACERGRDVYLIAKEQGDYPDIFFIARTDDEGRWSTEEPRAVRRGIQATKVTVLTLGDRRCAIAQSRTIEATPVKQRAPRAAVSITLQENGGRITSDRAACGRFRPVFYFSRFSEPAGQPYSATLISISRANGVWRPEEDGSMPDPPRRGGGLEVKALVAVLGTDACRPAQSAVQTRTSTR